MIALALFTGVVIIALMFSLINGVTNGGGLVATVITTRAVEPFRALMVVACCEIVGVFLLGQAVSRTLSQDMWLISHSVPSVKTLIVLFSGSLGALCWSFLMWRFALPMSSSHALVGGLLGAVLLEYGVSAVNWPVVIKVALFLAIVPVAGVLLSILLARAMYWIGEFLTPAARHLFRFLEVCALAGASLMQGSNDGQKALALVILGLTAWKGSAAVSATPVWPILLAAGLTMAVGILFGSKRIIQTLGKRLYRVQEMQGFCAEVATLCLVGFSSHWGYPVATSQVLSTSVLGAGMAIQPRDVRWNLVRHMGLVWLVTIPAAAILAACLTGVLRYVVS